MLKKNPEIFNSECCLCCLIIRTLNFKVVTDLQRFKNVTWSILHVLWTECEHERKYS